MNDVEDARHRPLLRTRPGVTNVGDRCRQYISRLIFPEWIRRARRHDHHFRDKPGVLPKQVGFLTDERERVVAMTLRRVQRAEFVDGADMLRSPLACPGINLAFDVE